MKPIDPAEQRALVLLERYEQVVRPELDALGSTLIPELDSAASVLRAATASQREVRVGFLGESQVGKSSLINALVGRVALPTGGVGPLTAQATRLRHDLKPSLAVRYHDRRRLNQFVFALRQYLVARGELTAGEEAHDDSGDDATAGAWSSAAAVDDDPSKGPGKNITGEHLVDQARLMLGLDEPEVSRFVVHDAIRSALGLEPLGDAAALAFVSTRIAEIRELLGTSAVIRNDSGAHAFFEQLHVNAAGWRSPLVAELDLALDADLLSRVEVVDLPGVGVVGDPAGKVAEDFVRDDAAALVIVARNNGLTEEVVGLLERTKVITRLLFGGDESRVMPIRIIFAITRLDDVAQDHYKRERNAARERGLPLPKREEVFKRLSAEMERKTKEQVSRTLLRSPQMEDLPEGMRERREQVVQALCDSLEVICVSAKDFLNLQDEEDRQQAFLQTDEATNIPHFRERLAQLAEAVRGSRRGRIMKALDSFRDLLDSHLDALEAGIREVTSASRPGAESFRAGLAELVPPLRERATRQRREVSAFLSERLPPQLDLLTKQAAERANKTLTRLRKHGSSLYWASLNAALTRNGTYDKRGLDYPGSLTTSFVEVIASNWEPVILSEVRRVVRKLVSDHVDLVEEFLVQASQLSGGDELLGQIHAHKRLLAEQGKNAVNWTAEQLHELSEDIRKKISEVVAKPIERACRRAIKDGQNRGSGASVRILEAFQQGAADAIELARASCFEILTDHFRRLRTSLRRLLEENADPITQCYEAIVTEGAALAERAGEAERQRRTAAMGRVRTALTSVTTADEIPPASQRVQVGPLPGLTAPQGSLIPMRSAATEVFDFDAEAE